MAVYKNHQFAKIKSLPIFPAIWYLSLSSNHVVILTLSADVLGITIKYLFIAINDILGVIFPYGANTCGSIFNYIIYSSYLIPIKFADGSKTTIKASASDLISNIMEKISEKLSSSASQLWVVDTTGNGMLVM